MYDVVHPHLIVNNSSPIFLSCKTFFFVIVNNIIHSFKHWWVMWYTLNHLQTKLKPNSFIFFLLIMVLWHLNDNNITSDFRWLNTDIGFVLNAKDND